jgi:hypothetical protein
MKLQALFEKVSQIVTITFTHHPTLTYTMALRQVGLDGNDRRVYVGNCEVYDSADGETSSMFTVAVFRQNGTFYAANYWHKMSDAVEAAGKVIASRRKAYGKGHRDIQENFDTYREAETTVEGYNLDKE